MNNNKNNNVLDLSDDDVKRLFSEFLHKKMRSNSILRKELINQFNLEERTIRRYFAGNLPKKIPQDTYISFLQALKTNDDEFRAFVTASQQDENPVNSKFGKSPMSVLAVLFSPVRQRATLVRLSLWGLILVGVIVLLWTSLGINENGENDYNLGVIAKDQKQHPEAISFFTKAIEKNDKNVDAYYALADTYAELANNEKAIEYYHKGIELDADFHPRAYNNLALLLLAQNDVNRAQVLLAKAEKNIVTTIAEDRWAQFGIVLKNKAWAYWKSESYAEAMKLIVQAQEQLGPAQKLDEFPEVFCLHALIAKHIGDSTRLAEQECIKRFKAYEFNQRDRDTGNTLKPIHGLIYELYQEVLKQHGKQ